MMRHAAQRFDGCTLNIDGSSVCNTVKHCAMLQGKMFDQSATGLNCTLL